MSRQRHELMFYRNQELMNDTNLMFIRIKKYMNANDNLLELFKEIPDKYDLPLLKPPTNEELDHLMYRLMHELQKDSVPMKKY